MSGSLIEWLALLLFLILFAAVIAGEILWLARMGWTTIGRAAGFVLATDFLGFGVGGVIVFFVFMALIMMTFGPAGRGSTAPEAAYIAVSAAALVVPAVILVLLKRLFLFLFKIGIGKRSWVYSIVSSLAILLIVLVPPPLFVYLASLIWK